jgi:signal transduction histidine kinase
VNQPAVLVISETPGFAQTVLDCFHLEANLPSPTAVNVDLCGHLSPDSFDLAIIEGLAAPRLGPFLAQLEPHGKTLLVLVPDAPTANVVNTIAPRALVMRQTEGMLPALMLIAVEALRRIEAENRLKTAEEALAASESSALLGRYITEMRHTINNALTSVMGNSELLLFEPGALSPHHRGQIETIRTMSIRIHEIMQRLASLETEMKWMEKQKCHDEQRKHATAAS